MRRTLIAPIVGLVLLAACGDDDGAAAPSVSSELQPYADALSSSFTADDIADDFTFTDENGDCVGAKTAEITGLDRLEAIGTPEEVKAATADDLSALSLEPDELDQVSEGFLDCVDDSEQLLEDAFLENADLTPEQSKCIADVVDRDLLIRILSAGIGGQDPETALADVQSEFLACV